MQDLWVGGVLRQNTGAHRDGRMSAQFDLSEDPWVESSAEPTAPIHPSILPSFCREVRFARGDNDLGRDPALRVAPRLPSAPAALDSSGASPEPSQQSLRWLNAAQSVASPMMPWNATAAWPKRSSRWPDRICAFSRPARALAAVTQAELAKCDVRSPIDGVVLRKHVSEGELVSLFFSAFPPMSRKRRSRWRLARRTGGVGPR
jgi:hypothetical protein